MGELVELAKVYGVSGAIIMTFFWWATAKLIPQLQQERSEALLAFRAEMAEERKFHREMYAKCTDDSRTREERTSKIIDHSLVQLAESVNNVAKIVSNHDTTAQGAINEIRETNRLQRQDHQQMTGKIDVLERAVHER